MTPHSLVQRIRIVLVFVAAAGVFLALGPFNVSAPFDKAVHAGCFYGFTLLALAALPWHRKNDVAWAAIGIGLASEFAQAVFGRDGSIGDILADAVGVGLAAAPLWVAQFRSTAQRHRFTSLADLRAQDHRRRAALTVRSSREPARRSAEAA